MSRLVIVGAGVAGVSAAGAARSAGWDGEIVLLSAEDQLPYRRTTVSKELVRGDKGPDEVRIKPAAWYEKNDIDLRLGVRVDAIVAGSQLVLLSDGSELAWDQLLLATGGTARRLRPVDLDSGEEVDAQDDAGAVTLRRMDDATVLHDRLADHPDVVVVGAGLIGSEIAASARQAGSRVTLLEAASLPMPRLLPASLGQIYASWHEAEGTDLHTDVTISAIRRDGDEVVVEADDGRSWRAPVVVESVGMVPDVALADAVDLGLDEELGGIAVDELGRTSVEGIWAAGDVAALPNLVLGGRHRVEHWQHAQNHGAAVGRAIAGDEKPFDEVPWCWSDQYGHTLQVTGWPEAAHDVVVRGSLEDRDFTAFFVDDGVLRGAIGIGRPREIRSARGWIGARSRVSLDALDDESAPLDDAVLAPAEAS